MRYFLANWKMHTTVGQAVAWVEAVQEALRQRVREGRDMAVPIVCPPFVSLVPVRAVMDREVLRLGAQNCHWEPEGPHTGEVSPTMLKGIVDYVMVGHSERRAAGETDEQIARKVGAVAGAGMVPILFVGEDEPGDDAGRLTEQRLRRGLSEVDPGRQEVLVIYEPAWAIGAEQAADADYVRKQVERLKQLLRDLGASGPEVVYGGTVNDDNIDQFAALEVLDGVGATRASLDTERFLQMIDRISPGTGGALW
ncbi:MAG: triose-phosphate isomerase [Actinomycetota bacterium]|nr:triose-phosphate isomerase [Actinomycetota bacterium]